MIKIKDELIKEFLNDNFNLNLFDLKLCDIREFSLNLDYIKQAYILEDLFGDIIMISRPFFPENLIFITYGNNIIKTRKYIKEKDLNGKYSWYFVHTTGDLR